MTGGRSACAVVLVVGMVVASAGCGGGSARTTTRERTVTTTVTETVTRTETQPPKTVPAVTTRDVSIYLLRGEQLGVGTRRSVESPAIALGAMRALVAGPSAADRRAGLGTAIPSGTTVHGVTITGRVATVDLSKSFESGGGSVSMLDRVAQVVYTLTALDGVDRVAFKIDGKHVRAIGGEGIVVDPSLGRADVEGQVPPNLVESPRPAAPVTSPLQVSGTANVFEAVLFVELRDGAKLVARKRVMASAGTGTRGKFTTRLTWSSASLRAPTLVAYDLSPRDGSRQDVVRIPLAP
jgi:hypothetical protein